MKEIQLIDLPSEWGENLGMWYVNNHTKWTLNNYEKRFKQGYNGFFYAMIDANNKKIVSDHFVKGSIELYGMKFDPLLKLGLDLPGIKETYNLYFSLHFIDLNVRWNFKNTVSDQYIKAIKK